MRGQHGVDVKIDFGTRRLILTEIRDRRPCGSSSVQLSNAVIHLSTGNGLAAQTLAEIARAPGDFGSVDRGTALPSPPLCSALNPNGHEHG